MPPQHKVANGVNEALSFILASSLVVLTLSSLTISFPVYLVVLSL